MAKKMWDDFKKVYSTTVGQRAKPRTITLHLTVWEDNKRVGWTKPTHITTNKEWKGFEEGFEASRSN